MLLEKAIDEEVAMYIEFCRKAAKHDEQELLWRKLAHVTFYHILELRSRNQTSPISI